MITASAKQMQPLQLRRPIQRLWQSIERHENSNVREELCIICMSAEPAPRHAPNKFEQKEEAVNIRATTDERHERNENDMRNNNPEAWSKGTTAAATPGAYPPCLLRALQYLYHVVQQPRDAIMPCTFMRTQSKFPEQTLQYAVRSPVHRMFELFSQTNFSYPSMSILLSMTSAPYVPPAIDPPLSARRSKKKVKEQAQEKSSQTNAPLGTSGSTLKAISVKSISTSGNFFFRRSSRWSGLAPGKATRIFSRRLLGSGPPPMVIKLSSVGARRLHRSSTRQ